MLTQKIRHVIVLKKTNFIRWNIRPSSDEQLMNVFDLQLMDRESCFLPWRIAIDEILILAGHIDKESDF